MIDPIIKERARNLTSVGSMDENDPEVGSSLIGSPACGDAIKLFVRIRDNKIVDAKFLPFGCASALSAASLMVEKLMNKDLSEADKIKDVEIANELKLRPIKFHCSVLAEAAIKAAIKNYFDKNQSI